MRNFAQLNFQIQKPQLFFSNARLQQARLFGEDFFLVVAADVSAVPARPEQALRRLRRRPELEADERGGESGVRVRVGGVPEARRAAFRAGAVHFAYAAVHGVGGIRCGEFEAECGWSCCAQQQASDGNGARFSLSEPSGF